MRRSLSFLCGWALLAASLRADAASGERVRKYFEGWYSVCPATQVTVAPAADIAIGGYESYRVERKCEAKNRNELSIALLDPARGDVFVGEVLYDGQRRDRPFAPGTDLPLMRAALQESYGLPVALRVGTGARGTLLPLQISLRLAEGAVAPVSGFVSQDGAALLVGEFHPLDVPPEQWRDAVLSETSGIRGAKGKFTVTSFIDFQCERCRLREPQVREFAAKQGGAIEIHFLPLVKVHDWSYAAAESAAALAGLSPELYAKYEAAIFPRAGEMNEAAARELAADVAEAAGRRDAYETEISSGKARERVVSDVRLALRLGLNSTPVFFYRGAFLTSEPNLAEGYIQSRIGAPAKSSAPGSPR